MLHHPVLCFRRFPLRHRSIRFITTGPVDPTNVSLLLKKHSESNSIEVCKTIHSKLIITGTVSDTYSANNVLNFYSRCGDLYHTRLLFETMSKKNVVTWTSMITAYIRCGSFEMGIGLFKQMIEMGEKPNQFTFSIAVHACINLGFLELGLQVHRLIVCFGLERDQFAGSSLVDMYSKLGCLDDAWRVFQGLFCRDTVCWNAMISGFAQGGELDEVLQSFSEMQADGLVPNGFTFTSLLKCCRCLKEVEQIHGFVLKSAIESNTVVGCTLVDMYGKCGNMNSSQRILDAMAIKDDFAWSAAISGYARNGNGEKSVVLFKEMCREGKKPDQHALSSVLKACIWIDEIEAGIQIHNQMIKTGYHGDCFVASVLIDLYSDFGEMAEAEKVFRRISDKDLVSWNSMIMGYAQMELTSSCFNLLCEFLQTATMKPDGFTFAAVLKSCQSKHVLDAGRQIHTQILKLGHDLGTHVGNAVINMYSKCDALDDARLAFDEIIFRDEISWGSMIASYVQNGLEFEALKNFKEMLIAGFGLNQFSFSSCLAACSGLEAIDAGRLFHSLIIKSGFSKEVYVGSSVINMYAKCGNIEDSGKAFHELQNPNIVTFNALISGFAQHGKAHEAIQAFEELENMNITPNNITFLAVLLACSHVGLLEESMFFFDSMRQNYGIEPELEHYCCLVDVFGRAGRLEEAYRIIAGTGTDLGSSVWRTLLSSCRKYGNVSIGEKSALKAMQLEPGDHAPYVLLSNIYSEAGRWEEALNLRQKMAEVGVRKNPGNSWVMV
eukprot:TRINITY_DN22515_c0_g1_i1.p1 TRINITY_DN22515_c0_g1~~TRINITY_DN22515_c0_g1_i1.p1  ORF type:complete len:778 (-),score=144.04 TRINITY_DN22515_c0_g1_i1:530-2863(-)